MRTTLRLDDALLREVRRIAVETGRTLTAVIQDALREAFARRRVGGRRTRTRLPVVEGGRLLAGVDLDDGAALLDRMEGRGRAAR
jgi:predicted transcriptional regulator